MGAASRHLVAIVAVASLVLSACGGDDRPPGIAGVDAYAERLDEQLAEVNSDLVEWLQDADRDREDLGELAEDLRSTVEDDDELPADQELASERYEGEGGTVSGERVVELLGPARTESLAFADTIEGVATEGAYDVEVIATLNNASSSATQAVSALREELAGDGA